MIGLLLLLAPDFVDVAGDLGLHGPPSGRAVFVDLNGDGRLDVVLDKRHLFFQRAGRFVKDERGLPGIPNKVPLLVLFADFDNVGDWTGLGGGNLFIGHTCTQSDWDTQIGSSATISCGRLLTMENGAKRELNGTGEGDGINVDERLWRMVS